MTLLLGLHGFFNETPARGVHDAAYCLADTDKGQILALVEMEKLAGVRHDGQLDQELLKAELAQFEGTIQVVSSHFTAFKDTPHREFPLFREIDSLNWHDLGVCSRETLALFDARFPHFVYLHELAHVFSAFLYRHQDHERFLGLVIEGCGSFAQNSLFLVDGFRVKLLEYNLPILSGNFFHQWLSGLVFDARRQDHSLRSATPGKVMALAAYGDAERFRPAILRAVRRHKPGQYMNYREGFCPEIEAMNLSWNDRVDLCASGQKVFQDLIVEQAVRIRDKYGDLPLYYAGGCALSIKTNSLLRQIFDEMVVPPNCGDDGIAPGLVALHAFLAKIRLAPLDHRSGFLSPMRDDVSVDGHLSPEDVEKVARWLADGEVVAFVQGSPEIGPRALCRRSILANPAIGRMREVLNHIKGREYFRPVAPIVLDSVGKRIFKDYFFSPFMLYDFGLNAGWTARIPAAMHVDGTARLQSVPDDGSDIARLLRAFALATGHPPILLNTSLNSRGKPIAATREQVMAELSRLKIKHVVLGDRAVVIA